MLVTLISILCLLTTTEVVAEQTMHHHTPAPQFDKDKAMAISQAAIGKTLGSYLLQKTNGEYVDLASFKGKPLIVSLIYTSCYHICPTTTQHLNRVTKNARQSLGDDSFNVVTIGFDVRRDNPPMMQYFAEQQNVDAENWHFLSTDEATIKSLAKQLGFLYFPSPSGFDHLVQTTLFDKELKAYRQIYGMTFEMPLLIEPLKRMILDTSEDNFAVSLSKQVLLFCTVYDPAQQKYKLDYSLFIGMFIGFMCVGVMGMQLVKEWRRTLGTKPS